MSMRIRWASIVCATLVLGVVLLSVGVGRSSAASKFVEQKVTNNDFGTIAFNGEIYVAGGSQGHLLVSKDMQQWTSVKVQRVSAYDSIDNLLWTGSEFIGTAREKVLSSKNGLDWVVKGNGPGPNMDARIRDLVYDGKQFVGTFLSSSYQAGYMTSQDGVKWTVSAKSEVDWVTAVASDGNRFVSLGGYRMNGNQGPIEIAGAYSTDKMQWRSTIGTGVDTHAYQPISNYGRKWGLIWDQKRFIAVGLENRVFSSRDGVRWEQLGEIPLYKAKKDQVEWTSIVWNGEQYTVVGGVERGWNDYYAISATSKDGVNWDMTEMPFIPTRIHQVIWANHQFVAVGGSGTILTSKDGQEWTTVRMEAHVADDNSSLTPVYYEGQFWLATGGYELGGIYRSNDGKQWEVAYTKYNAEGRRMGVNAMVSNPRGIFAITEDGWFVKSTDGVGFEERKISSNASIVPKVLAWTGSKYIVLAKQTVNSKEKLVQFSSSTGDQWTYHATTLPVSNIYDMKYNGGFFYSYNYDNKSISTSVDGVTWKSRLKISQSVNDFIVVNKQFYVWAENMLLYSKDGVKWSKHPLNIAGTRGIDHVMWDGQKFLGIQSFNANHEQFLLESKDGYNWTRIGALQYSDNEVWMQMLFHVNGVYIYADRWGGLYRSAVE